MRAILLSMVFIIATSGLASGQKKSKDATLNRDAKQEVVEVMRHGYGQNNVAVLDKILAEDFVFTSSRGIAISKTQELSDIGSGKMKTESASVDDLEVRVRGSAAIVTGRATLKGVWQGQDFSGQYRVTATWVKEDGRWRSLAEHASRITPQ